MTANDSFAELRINTERLLLRPMRESDASALFAIYSDPKVARYWSTPPWTSMDQAHTLIAKHTTAMALSEYLCLAIERKSDGQFIGMCTLFKFSKQCRRAEIGYGLARAAWGSGYMHEALVALLNYGFSAMSLNRVEADVDPRNESSVRSLVRLGFKKEGHLRERWIVDGEVSDSELYGLLFSDWKSTGSHSPKPRA